VGRREGALRVAPGGPFLVSESRSRTSLRNKQKLLAVRPGTWNLERPAALRLVFNQQKSHVRHSSGPGSLGLSAYSLGVGAFDLDSPPLPLSLALALLAFLISIPMPQMPAIATAQTKISLPKK
jgi:hypothetical protein